MRPIVEFLFQKSIVAVVPLLAVIVWAFNIAPSTPTHVDPWAAPSPSASGQLAEMIDKVGQSVGVGQAKAAGGDSTEAYEKARIGAVYAQNHYYRAATARVLGMSEPALRKALRQHGIIEWPEGRHD